MAIYWVSSLTGGLIRGLISWSVSLCMSPHSSRYPGRADGPRVPTPGCHRGHFLASGLSVPGPPRRRCLCFLSLDPLSASSTPDQNTVISGYVFLVTSHPRRRHSPIGPVDKVPWGTQSVPSRSRPSVDPSHGRSDFLFRCLRKVLYPLSFGRRDCPPVGPMPSGRSWGRDPGVVGRTRA